MAAGAPPEHLEISPQFSRHATTNIEADRSPPEFILIAMNLQELDLDGAAIAFSPFGEATRSDTAIWTR
jgi:hypothetical protein